MPYIWVEPELVLHHKDVTVYRAYAHDYFEEPLTSWFALYPMGTEDDAIRIVFDARTLKAWPKDRPDSEVDAEAVLKAAIDSGEIRPGYDEALPAYVTVR